MLPHTSPTHDNAHFGLLRRRPSQDGVAKVGPNPSTLLEKSNAAGRCDTAASPSAPWHHDRGGEIARKMAVVEAFRHLLGKARARDQRLDFAFRFDLGELEPGLEGARGRVDRRLRGQGVLNMAGRRARGS